MALVIPLIIVGSIGFMTMVGYSGHEYHKDYDHSIYSICKKVQKRIVNSLKV